MNSVLVITVRLLQFPLIPVHHPSQPPPRPPTPPDLLQPGRQPAHPTDRPSSGSGRNNNFWALYSVARKNFCCPHKSAEEAAVEVRGRRYSEFSSPSFDSRVRAAGSFAASSSISCLLLPTHCRMGLAQFSTSFPPSSSPLPHNNHSFAIITFYSSSHFHTLALSITPPLLHRNPN